jgi:hypothetical protein
VGHGWYGEQKEEALKVYGDSLVTSSLGVAHVNFAYEEMSPQVGMMNSIAEMWTFGETDFQVITMGSGFGKFGELRPPVSLISLATLTIVGDLLN